MYMVSQLNFIAKKTEKDLFSVITMIHSNRRWCYFCINIISSMWHAWHIYKIWWFKAICPTWCDWFCRVLCSLKPLCAKRDKKKINKKKNKKKLHLDKSNCSVYVFNVLCSACFSMEWNIPKCWLVFTKWISNTRPKHMQHYTETNTHTHSCICTVRWNTLRKLKLCDFWWMDWWKIKILLFFFFFCSHRLIFIQKQNNLADLSDRPPLTCFILPSQHTHTHAHTHIHSLRLTDSPELITHSSVQWEEEGDGDS